MIEGGGRRRLWGFKMNGYMAYFIIYMWYIINGDLPRNKGRFLGRNEGRGEIVWKGEGVVREREWLD